MTSIIYVGSISIVTWWNHKKQPHCATRVPLSMLFIAEFTCLVECPELEFFYMEMTGELLVVLYIKWCGLLYCCFIYIFWLDMRAMVKLHKYAKYAAILYIEIYIKHQFINYVTILKLLFVGLSIRLLQ